MKYLKCLSYCLPVVLLIFPTLNHAQPIDNQPYPYYCQETGDNSAFTATFYNNGSMVQLIRESDAETIDLPYWGDNNGWRNYGNDALYFQFNPVDLNSARVVVDGNNTFSDCATGVACPYVYISSSGQPEDYQFVGEVLRNIIGKSRETEQELVLPVQADEQGVVHIRIAEEKPEITYLDAAWLSVDGRRVEPDNCNSGSDLAYCTSDERYHVMEYGDAIELKFSVGELAADSKLELRARGYYLPHISLREQ